MKPAAMLKVTSLLSVVLFSIHIAGDIVHGMEPGTSANLGALPIMTVWLVGALLLAERRLGQLIMLLGALLSIVVPVLHMSGAGVGGAFARSQGAFLFIWTILALGVAGSFSAVLSMLVLFRSSSGDARRRGRHAGGEPSVLDTSE